MGWDSCVNWQTKKDALEDLMRSMIKSGWVILGQASTRQGAYYAIKNGDDSFIYCAMVKRSPRAKDFKVYVKTFSESTGPYMNDCPIELFKLVKEPSNEWAEEFRNRCITFANKKSNPVDLTGKTIKLYDKIYRVIGKVKRSYLIEDSTSQCYRMTKNQEMAAVVIGSEF